jgi:hypothetical protein
MTQEYTEEKYRGYLLQKRAPKQWTILPLNKDDDSMVPGRVARILYCFDTRAEARKWIRDEEQKLRMQRIEESFILRPVKN